MVMNFLSRYTVFPTKHPLIARCGIQIANAVEHTNLSLETKKSIKKFCLVDGLLYQERIWLATEKINDTFYTLTNNYLKDQNEPFPTIMSLKLEIETILYSIKNLLRDLNGYCIHATYSELKNSDASTFFTLKTGKAPIVGWAKGKWGEDHKNTKILASMTNYITEMIAKRNAIEHPGGKSGELVLMQPTIARSIDDGVTMIVTRPFWRRTPYKPTDLLGDLYDFCFNSMIMIEQILMFVVIEPNLLPGKKVYQIPGRRMKEFNNFKYIIK